MKLKSLRARITAQFTLLVLTVMVAIGGGVVIVRNRNAASDAQDALPRIARSFSMAPTRPGGGIPPPEGRRRPQAVRDVPTDPNTEAYWKAYFDNPRRRPPRGGRNLGIMVLNKDTGAVIYQNHPDNHPELPLPVNLKNTNDWFYASNNEGPVTVFTFVNKSDIQEGTHQLPGLLILGAGVLFFVVIGTWFMVGRTLRPINDLAAQANDSSVETLQVALTSPSQDNEVVNLVGTLNDLLGRIGKTAAEKGRFYAAASHELRTPIQALSGHLETALSRPRSEEEYEGFLQEAQAQTARLSSLVQDLLLLHQLEGRTETLKEDVELKDVAQDVLGHLEPLVEAKEMKLCPTLDEVHVKAPATHVSIMIRNLLENAAKYANWGGEVVTVTSKTPEGPRFMVFNECDNPPDWNSPAMQEAFYKGDKARSSRSGGNGLGLAICRAIAASNKWRFEIKNESNGVVASVWF